MSTVAPPRRRLKVNIDTTGAACAEHPRSEIFFTGEERDIIEAKRVCAGCPVRVPCFRLALLNYERFGVWGGLTYKEIASLRRIYGVTLAEADDETLNTLIERTMRSGSRGRRAFPDEPGSLRGGGRGRRRR